MKISAHRVRLLNWFILLIAVSLTNAQELPNDYLSLVNKALTGDKASIHKMLVLTRNLEGKNASVHGENLLRLYLGPARKTYESELKTLSKTDLMAVDAAISTAYKNPEVFERVESQNENSNLGQVPKKAAASEALDRAHAVKPWEKDEHIYSDPLDPYRACNQALDLAKQGDPEAIHRIFISAYVSESDPVSGRGEDGEGIVYDHQYLLATLGDQKFAEVLTFERPEVVSAVRIKLNDFRAKPMQFAARYPETHKILSSAPKIDFPGRDESPLMKRVIKFNETGKVSGS